MKPTRCSEQKAHVPSVGCNSLEVPERAANALSPSTSPDPSKTPRLRPHLDIPHELRQVEVPLLHEAGELQNEAHGVVRLLQARQALYRPHGVEALGAEKARMG